MGVNVLSVTNLSKAFGNRTLFDTVTFGLDKGSKVGLIGDNGSGKSTLLRILAGRLSADDGTIAVRSGLRIEFLEQVPEFPKGLTVRDVLAESFSPLQAAIEAYNREAEHVGSRADELLETIERLGGWEWEHRIERAASELGIDDMSKLVETQSGGFRKRVALARLWLANADIILLDEPTNHLDAHTVDWLESWLGQTPAAAILVTHDRYFLENVVTRMHELRAGSMRTYEGNYSGYLEARAIEEAHQENVRDKRLQLLSAEVEWARRSPKARSTKARARLDRVDDLRRQIDTLTVQKNATAIQFSEPERLGKTILEFVNVSKRYVDDVALITDFSLIARKGERYGIIGPNGAGKSTLLRLISEQIKPDSGTVVVGKNTQVAYFDQHRTRIDMSKSVRDNVVPEGGDTVFFGGQAIHIHSWLLRFGFRPEAFAMVAAKLSGGERNRLAMAQFLLEPANLLLLDEPTNDLDLLTLNVLEDALTGFAGCIFVVSHDRYFLDKVATSIIAFEPDYRAFAIDDATTKRKVLPEASIILSAGGYTAFAEAQDAGRKAYERLKSAALATKSDKAVAKGKGPPGERKLTYNEQKELVAIEPRIEAVESEIARLEAEVNDPEAWSGKAMQGPALTEALDAQRLELQTLMGRWEELMARS